MTQINRTGFNPNINLNAGIKAKKNEEKEEVSKEIKNTELKQKSADEVLNFMANSAIISRPVKTKNIEVSKYVTPEQAKRIAGFVQGFETEVGNGLKSFEKEFGQNPAFQGLSDATKLNIAANAFLKINMNE
jgi:hypothetical protein